MFLEPSIDQLMRDLFRSLQSLDPEFDEKVELIEREGHRQARMHLEHHKIMNMISLLAGKPLAKKSFMRWWKKFCKGEKTKKRESERRMHLYSSGGSYKL